MSYPQRRPLTWQDLSAPGTRKVPGTEQGSRAGREDAVSAAAQPTCLPGAGLLSLP